MKVKDILKRKGREVITIAAEATVVEAMALLSEHRIGAMIVMQGDALAGILSERDILRSFRDLNGLAEKRVHELMTGADRLIVATPVDTVQYAMAMMTEHRIKHIPVIEEGHLAGLISIGDAVKAMLDQSAQETKRLQDYITGAYPEE